MHNVETGGDLPLPFVVGVLIDQRGLLAPTREAAG
jgi:hypothetical protein